MRIGRHKGLKIRRNPVFSGLWRWCDQFCDQLASYLPPRMYSRNVRNLSVTSQTAVSQKVSKHCRRDVWVGCNPLANVPQIMHPDFLTPNLFPSLLKIPSHRFSMNFHGQVVHEVFSSSTKGTERAFPLLVLPSLLFRSASSIADIAVYCGDDN